MDKQKANPAEQVVQDEQSVATKKSPEVNTPKDADEASGKKLKEQNAEKIKDKKSKQKQKQPKEKQQKAKSVKKAKQRKNENAQQEAESVPLAQDIVFPGEEKSFFTLIFAMVGRFLYSLGFAAEYHTRQILRILLTIVRSVGQLAVWLFTGLVDVITRALSAFAKDLYAPFKRIRKRRAQLRRVRMRAKRRKAQGDISKTRTFLGLRAKTSVQFVANIVGIALPIAAVMVLVFAVSNMMNMQYALAVEVNGKLLGHVSSQNVVENAKGLLRDRIQLAQNQEISDWELEPSYTLARVDSYTTTHQLVNEILLSGSQDAGDLVQATGLYIDGELYAVTTEGERLSEYLDARLRPYEATAEENAHVSFSVEVECEPNENDVFFVSSVESYDEIVDRLEQVSGSDRTDTLDGEETLLQVAEKHGLPMETLKARNPEYADEAEDFAPEAGSVLLIERARPLLQVQVAFRTMVMETIPFEQIEEESDEHPMGAVVVSQEGVDGAREAYYDYVYIDGEMEERVLVEELTTVVTEPVPQITQIGTRDLSLEIPEGGFGGSWIFPVPSSTYSSRGMSEYHRGFDINATTGEPIFATQGGTVVTSGWHYSFGNHIVIDHGGGVQSLYAHCSALYVSVGQQVGQGQHIAAVGSTGNSTGPHLHLEVTVNGALVDPVGYVGYPY